MKVWKTLLFFEPVTIIVHLFFKNKTLLFSLDQLIYWWGKKTLLFFDWLIDWFIGGRRKRCCSSIDWSIDLLMGEENVVVLRLIDRLIYWWVKKSRWFWSIGRRHVEQPCCALRKTAKVQGSGAALQRSIGNPGKSGPEPLDLIAFAAERTLFYGIFFLLVCDVGFGEGSSRRGEAAEQPGVALSESPQIRRGGALLSSRPADLREQIRAGAHGSDQDEKSFGMNWRVCWGIIGDDFKNCQTFFFPFF